MTSGLTEPTFETTRQWWPDTPNIWTPLGWKDHPFRFNVLWNGTVLADPTGVRNRRAQRWRGQGVQIALAPHQSERFREIDTMSAFLRHDDGMVRQGWHDTAAPLRTRRSRDGKTLADTWRPRFRFDPRRIVLHIPPAAGLRHVKVNGKPRRPHADKLSL